MFVVGSLGLCPMQISSALQALQQRVFGWVGEVYGRRTAAFGVWWGGASGVQAHWPGGWHDCVLTQVLHLGSSKHSVCGVEGEQQVSCWGAGCFSQTGMVQRVVGGSWQGLVSQGLCHMNHVWPARQPWQCFGSLDPQAHWLTPFLCGHLPLNLIHSVCDVCVVCEPV